MQERAIWTFFYGSYMNLDVLAEVNILPQRWERARLAGFELRIEPRANLVESDQHSVYGIVAETRHSELERLYAHARDVLGETYLPEAVMVETFEHRWRAALCYICPLMENRAADSEYVERIARPAKEYDFPKWYLEHIEGFRLDGSI